MLIPKRIQNLYVRLTATNYSGPRPLKIFGLPRSCTNILTIGLRKNFECKVFTNSPCWKHGENTIINRRFLHRKQGDPWVRYKDVGYVVGVKHPFDWMLSLWKHEQKKEFGPSRSFEEFIRQPAWYYRERGLTAVDVFNTILPTWLDMEDDARNLQIVRQEDLMEDQAATLDRVGLALGLTKKEESIAPIMSIALPGERLEPKTFEPKFNRRKELSDETREFLFEALDHALCRRLGYDLTISQVPDLKDGEP